MLSSSSREGAQGTTIYTYDYKVQSKGPWSMSEPACPSMLWSYALQILNVLGGPVWKGRSNLMCLMQVDTTRGKKRIVSTVAIKGRRLYICNGTVKCSAPGLDCNPVGGPGTIEAVEAVSQSFDIL